MQKTKLLALLLMLGVASCQSGAVVDDFCLLNSPTRPTQAQIAAMSDAQVAQALARNKLGQKRCGWKA
jgi:hypothetical protein